jgi:hypothetical protein
MKNESVSKNKQGHTLIRYVKSVQNSIDSLEQHDNNQDAANMLTFLLLEENKGVQIFCKIIFIRNIYISWKCI